MEIQVLNTQTLDACQGMSSDALMVMPCTDMLMAKRAANLMARRAGASGSVLMVEDLDAWGFIRITNEVFLRTQGRYFGYVAQDAFAGRQWLHLALEALKRSGKKFLGFNDGKWQGLLASFGLAEREWALRNYKGNFFCPAYRSHYADTELTLLSMSESTYVYEPNSVLIEVDWNKDTASINHEDRKIFEARKNTGFDQRVLHSRLLNIFS